MKSTFLNIRVKHNFFYCKSINNNNKSKSISRGAMLKRVCSLESDTQLSLYMPFLILVIKNGWAILDLLSI